jgi:Zn-dependent protease
MIEIILFVCVGLAPAIVLHEYAHGWVANQLGDPTARLSGRLTLNPIKHIDPVGSIIVPGMLLFAYLSGMTHGLFLFGWAKPVPVNFSRLNNPKRDMMLVAVAGPVVNMILAFLLAGIIRPGIFSDHTTILKWALEMNLILAVFNMVPVPPLDGSRIVSGLLPSRAAYSYNRLEPWGIFIVLLALNLGFLNFIYPIVDLLAGMLGVSL